MEKSDDKGVAENAVVKAFEVFYTLLEAFVIIYQFCQPYLRVKMEGGMRDELLKKKDSLSQPGFYGFQFY